MAEQNKRTLLQRTPSLKQIASFVNPMSKKEEKSSTPSNAKNISRKSINGSISDKENNSNQNVQPRNKASLSRRSSLKSIGQKLFASISDRDNRAHIQKKNDLQLERRRAQHQSARISHILKELAPLNGEEYLSKKVPESPIKPNIAAFFDTLDNQLLPQNLFPDAIQTEKDQAQEDKDHDLNLDSHEADELRQALEAFKTASPENKRTQVIKAFDVLCSTPKKSPRTTSYTRKKK